MHWYPKYTSDFIGATLDLSYLEKVSYGWMLDIYYERREPLPLDSTRLFRLLGCESDEQKQAIKTVLNLFFVKKEDGWYNEKAEQVIKKQAQRSDLAKFSAKVRWDSFEEKKLNEINETTDANAYANALRTHCERNANAMLSRTRTKEVLTTRPKTKQDQLQDQSQGPVLTTAIASLDDSGSNNAGVLKTEINNLNSVGAPYEKNSQISAITEIEPSSPSQPLPPPTAPATRTGKRLDPLWMLPKAWGDWAMQKFPNLTEREVADEAERFRDYWISIPGAKGRKIDWAATWRNWCRQGFAQGIRSKKLSTAEHNQRAVDDFLNMTGIKPTTTTRDIENEQD